MADSFIEIAGIRKQYGATTALKGVSLAVNPGEIIGLIGSNGAGKSTLGRVVSGVTRPDGGLVTIGGRGVDPEHYSPRSASRMGIRVVYQELSLCSNLDVRENFFIEHHDLYKGTQRWRNAVSDKTRRALNDAFPGNGINSSQLIQEMPINQRQMVEIARAVSVTDLKLLILDEPTSSLGSNETEQLLAYLKKLSERGVSIILVTHRLKEVLSIASRFVVMRNGSIEWAGENRDVSESFLVEKMTRDERVNPEIESGLIESRINSKVEIVVENLNTRRLHDIRCRLNGGELIGISGLDGNGQQDFMKEIFFSPTGLSKRSIKKSHDICYISGDRRKEGIFPLWPVKDNIGITEYNKLSLFKPIDVKEIAGRAKHWFERLRIKADTVDSGILSLSGGNQQKVLVARSLISDSDIIFLDDPTKGVDVDTKQQMYALFREAAENGKLVVWYSTEDDEFLNCTRVLVFRYGHVVDELNRADISKAHIVESSFKGEDLLKRGGRKEQTRIPFEMNLVVPAVALALVFVVSGLYQRNVFTWFGVDLLLTGSIPLVCAAVCQMLIIGLSHVDLSVGAYMGLVNVLCATILVENPLLGALFLCLSIAVYGLMGALIYVRKIPAVIVTMGMSFVWTGIAYTIQDRPGGSSPEWLTGLFRLDFPIPQSIVLILLISAAIFFFYRSKYGTALRGFGNNPAAMENSGWRTVSAYIGGYCIAAFFATIGGMAITTYTGASDANSTASYTMLTIAAVVMGGSKLLGGFVSPVGTIIGAVTLSLVGALLGFMRLSSSYVTAVQGLILLTILATRLLRNRRYEGSV